MNIVLLQAPLAGFTTAASRAVTWKYGRPDLLATEMVSAEGLLHEDPAELTCFTRHADDEPTALQLWGRDVDDMAEAARRGDLAGFDAIDLNCGCPVRHVVQAGAGGALMKQPALIGKLVAAMVRATTRPVTVKIRLGPAVGAFNADEVARIAEAEGATRIAVHGRYIGERYQAPCRLEGIARVVQAVGIPVIGNGDVVDGATAREMVERTGCAGVMIGRASMGAPWVFQKIRAQLAGRPWTSFDESTVLAIFLEEVDLLARYIGEDEAMRRARKVGAFYSRHLHDGKAFRVKLNHCRTREQLGRLCEG